MEVISKSILDANVHGNEINVALLMTYGSDVSINS
jgi:hypothetical protein